MQVEHILAADAITNYLVHGKASNVVNGKSKTIDIKQLPGLLMKEDLFNTEVFEEVVVNVYANYKAFNRRNVMQAMAILATESHEKSKKVFDLLATTPLSGEDLLFFSAHFIRNHKANKSFCRFIRNWLEREGPVGVSMKLKGIQRQAGLTVKDLFRIVRPVPKTAKMEATYGMVIGNTCLDWTKVPAGTAFAENLNGIRYTTDTNKQIIRDMIHMVRPPVDMLPVELLNEPEVLVEMWRTTKDIVGLKNHLPVIALLLSKLDNDEYDNLNHIITREGWKLGVYDLGILYRRFFFIPKLRKSMPFLENAGVILSHKLQLGKKRRVVFLELPNDKGADFYQKVWAAWIYSRATDYSSLVIYDDRFIVADKASMTLFSKFTQELSFFIGKTGSLNTPLDLMHSDANHIYKEALIFHDTEKGKSSVGVKVCEYWMKKHTVSKFAFITSKSTSGEQPLVLNTNHALTIKKWSSDASDKLNDFFTN